MRVISGKLKGRSLHSFQASHIRPTTDRVKETMFNKLMGRLPEARVLDLFAGTGNLGIEAYSRGAKEVIMVEESHKSIQIINKNLKSLQINEGVSVVKKDVFLYLNSLRKGNFDLIFVDPPFTKMLAHQLMTDKALIRACGRSSLVILESSKQERLDANYPGYELWNQKNFGDKILSFWSPLEKELKND